MAAGITIDKLGYSDCITPLASFETRLSALLRMRAFL